MDAIETIEKEAQKQMRNSMARQACEEVLALGLVKTKTALAESLEWKGPNLSDFFNDKRGIPDRQLSLLIRKYGDQLSSELPPDPFKDFSNDQSNVNEDDYLAVPIYESTGSAGGGSHEISWGVLSHIKMHKLYLRPKCSSLDNLGFVPVVGDSMIPTIPPGAFALVDRGKTDPVHGKVFLVSYDNQLFIKRLEVRQGTITALISDKDLSRIEIGPEDNFQILGQVLLQHGEV